MQLQEILALCNISEEALDKVLAHDRWKVEQQFAHEKWVAEFNAHIKGSVKPKVITSESLSEDDVLVNELTGYGELDTSHIGKLQKTKQWTSSMNGRSLLRTLMIYQRKTSQTQGLKSF
jgi:hypothetical protein